jgi:hypothetical protein
LKKQQNLKYILIIDVGKFEFVNVWVDKLVQFWNVIGCVAI